MKRTRKGFTLIELLVVIAIIAILAAILFPIFSAAKNTAKQSQCLNNLAELGKAIQMYTGDTGGKLPYWCDWDPNTGASRTTWDTYINKYVKNPKIFTCPVNCVKENGQRYPSGVYIRSYAMPKNVSGVMYEQAPKLSMTVLLFEKGATTLGGSSDACGEWFDQCWGYTRNSKAKYWHGEGKNFAFVDGHSKYFKSLAGPFKYDYPSLPIWSGDSAPTANPGGVGYCGYQNTTAAGRNQRPKSEGGDGCMPGANIPQ